MATRKPIVNVAGTLRELPAGDGVAVGDVVGLGTAAAANLTTSKVDTTAGRVLKVGDFGLGEYTPTLTKSQENTLLNGRSNFYSTLDESDLQPYAGVLQIGYSLPGYAAQIASAMGNSVPTLKVRVLNNNVWGQPVTLLHTNNLAQGVGGSTEYPMSQAATTAVLNSKADVNASTTGNAATATKLATARTINGVAFDGTQNITIATGAALASSMTAQYDAQDRVSSVTEDGVQTTITYDSNGRVATTSYPRAGKTRTETYSYNDAGQLTGMSATEA